ncbi:hypothetical protein BHE74_00031240 [Ensete ventricosum]|nr:hypothetical protein BHE74_00031240 [Ensete ventricosum]
MVIYFARIAHRFEFRSVLLAPSQKFKILDIPDVLAHGIVEFRRFEFRTVFSVPSRKFKILAIPDVLTHGKSYKYDFAKQCDGHKLCAKVKFRSVFRAPSRKFEILAIPGVLAHESSFDRFFSKVSIGFSCTVLEIQNSGNSQRISP